MAKVLVLKWEVVGTVFIIILGSILHSAFIWIGYWRPLAWLLPVNESIWEHFKMAFWPGLLFALLEWAVIHKSCNNFWMGKSLGLFSMPVTIGVLFYGYTAVLGHNFFVFDILIFLVAVLTGQWISYQILTSTTAPVIVQRVSLFLLVALIVAFVWFSYSPPHMHAFKDSLTQSYGIPEQ